MVVPSPLGWEPIPTRPRSWRRWIGGIVLLLIAAVIVLNLITVPYYRILPGDALPVNGSQGSLTVNSVKSGSGRIFLATVLLQSRVTEWDRVTGFLHPTDDLVKSSTLTGGETQVQYNQQNQQEMDISQEYAKVAGLRRLGYVVPELGDGAQIVDVAPNTPADGNLRAGDIITGIDAKPVKLAQDVTSAVTLLPAGADVAVTVKRPLAKGSSNLNFSLRTVACGASDCPTNPNRALIGIRVITDNDSFVFPPKVNLGIASNGIGGPSAGLAFTLGALDSLTSHDLTGGHRVAATGTIDPTGVVGDVGGVKQKTVAVERQHCEYFIVPRGELAAARAEAHGKMTIVPVDNLEQVLGFLRSIGGNLTGIPATPPAAVTE